MIIRREKQLSPVTDEVTSIIAVIRPILQGLLYSLKEEVVMQSGGYENIPLFMLPRAYRRGDGDCGICFESRGITFYVVERLKALCHNGFNTWYP